MASYTPGYLKISRSGPGEHKAWCLVCHTKKRGYTLEANDANCVTWYREHAQSEDHARRRADDVVDRFKRHYNEAFVQSVFGPSANPRRRGPREPDAAIALSGDEPVLGE